MNDNSNNNSTGDIDNILDILQKKKAEAGTNDSAPTRTDHQIVKPVHPNQQSMFGDEDNKKLSAKPGENVKTEASPKPEQVQRPSSNASKPSSTIPAASKPSQPQRPKLQSHSVQRQAPVGTVNLSDFDSIGRNHSRTCEKEKSKFFLPGYVKVILYLAAVFTVSIFLAVTAIKVGNDVFAFVKPDKEVTFIIPQNATLDDVADALYDNGLIKYPSVYKIYAKFRMDGKEYYTGAFVAGEHTYSTTTSYDKFIEELAVNKNKKEVVRVTIPEGFTVLEILDLLEKNRVINEISRKKLEENLNCSYYNYQFLPDKPVADESEETTSFDKYQHIAEGYALLELFDDKNIISIGKKENLKKSISDLAESYSTPREKINPDKFYNLEGYLFPDTYDFYVGEDLDSLVGKFLSNFNRKFEESYYERCKELGMTIDEVITLASMIEAEGRTAEDFYNISSVFHNRLKQSGTYPFLNSDATTLYSFQGEKKKLDAGDNQTRNHPYNTYLNKGLPPGPICNPGDEAIHAALYPENTRYKYFYTASGNGLTYFSETESQHNNYIQRDMLGLLGE